MRLRTLARALAFGLCALSARPTPSRPKTPRYNPSKLRCRNGARGPSPPHRRDALARQGNRSVAGRAAALLQELVRYWGDSYDWRKAEAKLNASAIHHQHRRGRHPLHPRPFAS